MSGAHVSSRMRGDLQHRELYLLQAARYCGISKKRYAKHRAPLDSVPYYKLVGTTNYDRSWDHPRERAICRVTLVHVSADEVTGVPSYS